MNKYSFCFQKWLQVEIWEQEWNGISLMEVAREMNLPPGQVASYHFYELYYKKLAQQQFIFDEHWTKQKQRMTALFKDKIDTMPAGKESKVISLGAGLGIIEFPLIKAGYNIHLQEAQQESLANIQEQVSTTVWVTPDLSTIPDNSYDLILVSIVSYVFDLENYQEFLKNCGRILAPGGLLVIWDLECPIPFLYSIRARIKRSFRHDHSIKWGWIRHTLVHRTLAANSDLILTKMRSLNNVCDPVEVNKVMGFVLPRSKATLQELTFINKKKEG